MQLRNPFSYQNSEHSIIYNIIYVLIVSPFNKHFICSKPLGTNGVVQLVSLTSSIAQQTGMCNHNTIVDAKRSSVAYICPFYDPGSLASSFLVISGWTLHLQQLKLGYYQHGLKARSVISTNILNKVSCKENINPLRL